MTNLLGANWRTSLTGVVETICLVVIAGAILPVDWEQPKAWVPAVLLIAAKTIKDFITKDKNVTGGAVQQNPQGEVTGIAKAVPPAIPIEPKI